MDQSLAVSGMNLGDLQRELAKKISSMYEEKLLDTHFQQLQELKDAGNPDFIVVVINMFIDETNKTIQEINKEPRGNDYFSRVSDYVHKLKGSSSSVGACKVKDACVEFHQAYAKRSSEGCREAVQKIYNDFGRTESKFQDIVKLEVMIMDLAKQYPRDTTQLIENSGARGSINIVASSKSGDDKSYTELKLLLEVFHQTQD